MKISKSIIMILLFFLFVNCEKRPFAKIELHGQIIDRTTNQPLSSVIELWVGGASPGEKGTTQFASVYTNGDGTFDIKSKAQWSSNDYNLQIIPNSGYPYHNVILPVHVSKNQNLDVGTIAFN